MTVEQAGLYKTGPLVPLAKAVAAQRVPETAAVLGRLVLQAAQTEVMR